VLADEAGRLVGGKRAVLVVDDTGLPEKGSASVGVAEQYCGQLGKQANCQVIVSLTLAQDEVPVPVGLRLFLPKAWAEDPGRCARAGVPEAARTAQGKPELALAEIDRVRAAGVAFGCVLADAGYGMSAEFRRGLSERQLAWAVGIPRTQKVYTTAVQLEWPQTRTGRPRKVPAPSEEPRPVDAVLAAAKWRRLAWRQGTKGALAARFATLRIRVGDGRPTRTARHLPGDEAWLVGEWRDGGERKFYLNNLAPRTSLRALAAAIKARWVCEQAHQQLKQEVGLGDFEGRSWTGLHRHALMACIAYAFLQHLRLRNARGRGKNDAAGGSAGAAEPARDPSRHHGQPVRVLRRTTVLPALRPTMAGYA